MPGHKGLSLSRFVSAVPPDLLERYFASLRHDQRPVGWATLNSGALEEFLTHPQNAEAAAIIEEDFRRINDIARDATGLVVRAYEKFQIELPVEQQPEALAMRLFINHSEAFTFAWSRYLLYASGSRLSIYPIGRDHLSIGQEQIVEIEDSVRSWYADQAKGQYARVHHFDDNGESVILIQHGSYVRTAHFWDGDDISLQSFRPAIEDVMVYEPDTGLLRVKAALKKDREEFLRLFATHVAGDERVAEAAKREEVFSLASLQDGTFNFDGNGPITRIDLRRVTMKLYGAAETIVDVKAADVRSAFDYDLGELTLQSGILTMVRLQFHIQYPGESRTTVTFDIQPPSRTSLAEKLHSDVIMRYLEQQGVKLQ